MTDLLCEKCNSDIIELIKKEKNIYKYIDIIQERINNNILKKNNLRM